MIDPLPGKVYVRFYFSDCEHLADLGYYAGGLYRAGFDIAECADLDYDREVGSIIVEADSLKDVMSKWRKTSEGVKLFCVKREEVAT